MKRIFNKKKYVIFSAFFVCFLGCSTITAKQIDISDLQFKFNTFKSERIKQHNVKFDNNFKLLKKLPYQNVLTSINKKDSSIYLSPFEKQSILLFSKSNNFEQSELDSNEITFFDNTIIKHKNAKEQKINYSFINVKDLSFLDYFDDNSKLEYEFLVSLYDSNIRVDDLISFSSSQKEVLFYRSAFTRINAIIQYISTKKPNADEIENLFNPLTSNKISRNIEIIALQYIINNLKEIYSIDNYEDNVKLTKAIIKRGVSSLYQSTYDSHYNDLNTELITNSFFKLFKQEESHQLSNFYLSNSILEKVLIDYFKYNKKTIPNKYKFSQSLNNKTSFDSFLDNEDKIRNFENKHKYYFTILSDKLISDYTNKLNNPENIFNLMISSLIVFGSEDLNKQITESYKFSIENPISINKYSMSYHNSTGKNIKILS